MAGVGSQAWPFSWKTAVCRSIASITGATNLTPRVFFARIAGRDRLHLRWHDRRAPSAASIGFAISIWLPGHPSVLSSTVSRLPLKIKSLIYPRIGHMTRRWFQIQRKATENRQGQRHDSSAQQVEYHGLRDYRSGDSPRWIHWRTSARRGELMVKEFEHQNEQDLAISD